MLQAKYKHLDMGGTDLAFDRTIIEQLLRFLRCSVTSTVKGAICRALAGLCHATDAALFVLSNLLLDDPICKGEVTRQRFVA